MKVKKSVIFLACNNNIPQYIGDGYCDDENNNKDCQFDGGDCCGSDINTKFCSECQCLGSQGGTTGVGTTQSSVATSASNTTSGGGKKVMFIFLTGQFVISSYSYIF